MTIQELKERLGALNEEAQQIRATAQAEKRDLSVEEAEKLDRILSAFERTEDDINRLEKLERQTQLLTKPTGRKTEPAQPERLSVEDGQPRRRDTVPADYTVGPKNGGFKSLGEFGLHVHRACTNGGTMDARLERLASASTYGSEGSGADGGFAVPPDFRSSIMQVILAEDQLLSLCDQITVTGNSFTCPVDETTPWQTSGGILANWEGEASAATQSKPNLTDRTTKLYKLRALVPMTEELLEDASAMDAYLRKKTPEKIAFKINDALVNGTGAGIPLGILNAPATVSVAKETSQTATTLIARNVMKMYNRMYAPSRSKAVWLINQDIEPELFKLAQAGTDAVGNAVTGWGSLVYMPPGGLSAAPFGTLYGRPVIPTQACQTLGTVGDILFVDFSQYLALLKSGPNPRVDVSMHLWFDQDLTAFKFILRMGGVPWWSTTVSAKNGSATYSPYVSLATRS